METTGIETPSMRDRRIFANHVAHGLTYRDIAPIYRLTPERCSQICREVADWNVELVAGLIWRHQAVGSRYEVTVPHIKHEQAATFRYLAWLLSQLNKLDTGGDFIATPYEVGDATVFAIEDRDFGVEEGAE